MHMKIVKEMKMKIFSFEKNLHGYFANFQKDFLADRSKST